MKHELPPGAVLISITAPTCAGKSHLLNFIRRQGLPCITSMVTRAPRVGEAQGIDYYFKSHAEFSAVELGGELAEKADVGGQLYGVTWTELQTKLDKGSAFIILEPKGLHQYISLVHDQPVKLVKVFVDTPLEIRLKRFNDRFALDLERALHVNHELEIERPEPFEVIRKLNKAQLERHRSILMDEATWESQFYWDARLDGRADPEKNLEIIESLIINARKKQ